MSARAKGRLTNEGDRDADSWPHRGRRRRRHRTCRARTTRRCETGWTCTVKTGKPATPLSNDDGAVTEIVTEIDWKAAAGNAGIKPGEFDTFVISVGPLPKVETLTFKAVQTYSDRTVGSRIETPAAASTEPAHPAPTISLAAALASAASRLLQSLLQRRRPQPPPPATTAQRACRSLPSSSDFSGCCSR